MIDLHIHTNCSDGALNVNGILKMAEELELTHISITDHNNCNAYFEMDRSLFSGEIINGFEPECFYFGRCIELLGYGIDVEKCRKLLKGIYRPMEEIHKEQYKQFYNNLVKGGVRFSEGIFEKWDKSKHYYGGCHLHADLIKFPENKKIITDDESWNNSIQFYRNWASRITSPFYVDESDFYPTARQIYKIIKKSGGKVFIPHTFVYGDSSLTILEGLMKEFQIDGIECYYPSFTQEQTQFLLDFCRKNNLLISAGSDFHGGSRPNKLTGHKNKCGTNIVVIKPAKMEIKNSDSRMNS